MSNLGASIKLISKSFFDRPAVERAAAKASSFNLGKFGAFVRQTAQKSIAERPGIAPPGHPPYSHTGLLKKNIFFAYDKESKSVVVGAIPINTDAPSGVPLLLEEGGQVSRGGRTVTYSPRPYMLPAFNRERADMSRFWRGTIKK